MNAEQAENLTLAIRGLSAAIGSLEETIAAVAGPPPSKPPARPSSGKQKLLPRGSR